ncbi:hypothetical protein [Leptolyngbya sp. FACHB-261]|uniref:hypothetical protein n=1 Tax=Leptolyngbya sp. FACHB-261 TaxID=2692806 RepID=UPI0016843804|nr:hypothetical protein [Leptolyngbya sp. FACHB-261]MBD2104808.1 hypothetical protein [Leptolyngbya sp. FACHB-261]
MTDALNHATTLDSAIKVATVASVYRQEFPGSAVCFTPESEQFGSDCCEIVFQFDYPLMPGFVILAVVFNNDTRELESVDIGCWASEADLDWDPSFYIYEQDGGYWLGAVAPLYASQFVRIAQRVYQLFEGFRLPVQMDEVEQS